MLLRPRDRVVGARAGPFGRSAASRSSCGRARKWRRRRLRATLRTIVASIARASSPSSDADAALRELEQRAQALLHAVDGVFRRHAFRARHSGERGALRSRDARELVEDVAGRASRGRSP